jgi:hypothetical protein
MTGTTQGEMDAQGTSDSMPVEDAPGAVDSAPVEASSVLDSSGTGDANQMDASGDAPQPTCGPPPARYSLLTGADAGLVRDNVTMLVWMSNSHGGGEPPQTQPDAAAYCSGMGMRLPTEDEALALAANYASCAFGNWGTWTSTAAPAMGDFWVVDYLGDASPQLGDNFPSAVLCVRDPAG